MNTLELELNIALTPEPKLAQQLVALSQNFANRYPTIIQLGPAGTRLTMAPHLTLYQAPALVSDLAALDEQLAALAKTEQLHTLRCTGLIYNESEASLECRKEVTDVLVALQNKVIAVVNPLRGDLLLERDPAGNQIAELLQAPGKLGENIRETGYAEVGDPRTGGLFRPHDTLNWFTLGTAIDVAAEQQMVDLSTLSGAYETLSVFALGPYGTCPQLLSSYRLGTVSK